MRITRHHYFAFILIPVIFFGIFSCSTEISSAGNENFISFKKTGSAFPLAGKGLQGVILMDENEFSGVKKVAGMFSSDLEQVTGVSPVIRVNDNDGGPNPIIIGTLGKNKLIDSLIDEGKLDVDEIRGKWESTLIQVMDNPFEGCDRALVIVGSDKRGTIYGMFDISRKIGVSPWYWWADVPVKKHEEIYLRKGRYILGEPKVRYRGIFLNDEEPALGSWARENYGGFTHGFYEKVFELILRLKGNYLWPAMWWASFNSDDPLNPELADELGIVMGTTHHEPMMRAHAEWKQYGGKEWNYATNEEQLRQFWTEGIERMDTRESIVSLGMRGDGDMAMSEETNIALLEKIVDDQRKIIEETTGKPAAGTPQLWALYKEVQEYYDMGMRVPDDVTLLLCDDNWGNIRRLPEVNSEPRKGGYGIYYHFDYVGGPRNYKWINTNPLPRVWEQMNLAYRYGVDRIWLVNVGDLKPMELPISFFLDLAWDPDQWPAERLDEYTVLWAEEQFGEPHAGEIAEILRLYPKYNNRRKPELLNEKTYSLVHYREFERIVAEYNTLKKMAEDLYESIDPGLRDAFYQLVLHPVEACSNLNEMYYFTALNHLYAEQERSTTREMATRVRELYLKDSLISVRYHEISGGKWNHMMSQTHIGYTYWQQPEKNSIPDLLEIKVPDKGILKVAVEGSRDSWPGSQSKPNLPVFDNLNDQQYYIEIFNTGKAGLNYRIEQDNGLLEFSEIAGKIENQEKIIVSVNWDVVDEGMNKGSFYVIPESGEKVSIQFKILKTQEVNESGSPVFVENNRVVSMNAENFTREINADNAWFEIIQGMGRTGSSVTTFPVTVNPGELPGPGPVLEYDFYLLDKPEEDSIGVIVYLSPTLDFHSRGLFYAISIDEGESQKLNIFDRYLPWAWGRAVSNNIYTIKTRLRVDSDGRHTLRYRPVSGGIVLQKIVIDNGGLKPSYLGPPESNKPD